MKNNSLFKLFLDAAFPEKKQVTAPRSKKRNAASSIKKDNYKDVRFVLDPQKSATS